MRRAASTSLAFLAAAALACGGSGAGAPRGGTRIVLRFGPLGPDPAPLRALVDGFERAHPGVHVAIEPVPNDGDLAHQLLVTALGAGAEDLDVFAVDIVWVPELTRAGWLADLSDAFPPARIRADFLAGPAQAVVRDGRTRAVPWFVDVGLLYYRRDLVPEPPRTYAALERDARAAMARIPGIAGFVWQGRQYEGLSCNFFESLWGHGGGVAAPDRLPLDDPAAPEALRWLRHLVSDGVSPGSVLVAAEEDARRLFGTGGAVFMRNWPYAWPLLQDARSPVRGRVGVAPLPSADGTPGPGVLGG